MLLGLVLVAGPVFAIGCGQGTALLGTGRSADAVFADLQDAGLPIADGRPASSEFQSLVDSNRCEDSRSFIRTDTDNVGWGLICVGLDKATFNSISSTFESVPALVGPLYADADDGNVIVVGFGWPVGASEIVHDVLGDESGSYLASRSLPRQDLVEAR